MKFTDKKVLITGAARGIGKAIAREFAAEGARVALHYKHSATAAAELLETLPGGPHLKVQADVSSPEDCRQLVQTVVEAFGCIDILVNNAGISITHNITECNFPAWESAWRTTLETNLVGPVNLAFWAVKHMLQQGGGRIVNITSRGAFRGEPDNPAYGAAKAGLNSFTQSMAKALAPFHIFVAAVAPGWVETDMAAELLPDDEYRKAAMQSPTGRMARPQEIAKTVLFLASDEVEHITGAIVDVNGASYLRS